MDRHGKKRHLIVLWAFLEILCFGGLQFGWGSLIYVLKDEGVFGDLCEYAIINTTATVKTTVERQCPEQDLRLNLFYTIGSGCAIFFNLLSGQIFSRFGTRAVRCLYICFFWCGCIMIVFTNPELPWLICPGVLFVTGGSLVFQMTTAQFSNMYKTGSIIVLGLMYGVMGSSSVIQQLVKLAHTAGFRRKYSYLVIIAASVTTLISTFTIFPKHYIYKESEGGEADKHYINMESERGEADIHFINKESEHGEADIHYINKESERGEADIHSVYKESERGEADNTDPLKSMKGVDGSVQFKKYVFNPIFIPHVLWFGILTLHFIYYIAAINAYLDYITGHDQQKVSYFTNVLAYTMVCGVVSSFVAGYFYDHQKQKYKHLENVVLRKIKPAIIPMVIATTLMLLLSISMMLPYTWVLYITFIDFTIFRSFLFCVALSFLSDVFPTRVFGILFTLMLTQMSIMYFVAHGLFEWWNSYEGAIWHIHILLLLLSILAFAHPIAIYVHYRRLETNLQIDSTTESFKAITYFAVLEEQ